MSIFSAMTLTSSRTGPDVGRASSHDRPAPIQLQTENGFSIIRRRDIDEKNSPGGAEHGFIVRDPYGYELEITVDFSPASIGEVIMLSRGRLTLASAYWITCAERHLADYLWENDDYPPNGKITIDYLTPDDLDLVRRWGREIPTAPLTPSTCFRSARSILNGDPANSKSKAQPITVVTENGYSIVRLSDLDRSITDSPQACHFQVANPEGGEREIRVRFDEVLLKEIQSRRRGGSLAVASKYWPVIAEKYLADYLWREDDFPPTGQLNIEHLSGDDLLLGLHWQEQHSTHDWRKSW